MKINPLYDQVVVQREEVETKTPSGLFIPAGAEEISEYANVVAVGKGKVFDNGTVRPMSVQPGNKVLLGKHAGRPFKIDGVEYLQITEDDILGIIE